MNQELQDQVLDDTEADLPPSDPPIDQATPPEEDHQGGGDDVETRARAQGWVPQEEFRGNPDQWRDADEFVRRGEEELPILRERNRTLSRQVDDIRRESKAEVARLERMTEIALRNQRAQIHSEFENAKRQAAEIGDLDRYDQLGRDHGEALHSFDQQFVPQQQDPRQQQVQEPNNGVSQYDQEVANRWISQNSWMNDPEMRAVAEAHHVRLGKEKPGLRIEENLSEVARYVRQRYPEKFSTAPQSPSAVEGGSRTPGRQRANSANTLPADARAQGKKFVEQGLFKDLDHYAKEFYAQDA